jgi:hypothetical protein
MIWWFTDDVPIKKIIKKQGDFLIQCSILPPPWARLDHLEDGPTGSPPRPEQVTTAGLFEQKNNKFGQ